MSNLEIRDAEPGDAPAVAAIYAHHVQYGTASYEFEPPTTDETREKILRIRDKGWPFLVACVDGEVAGYAYATQFRDRPAYRHTCENSIYVHPDRLGQGIGIALLGALCRKAEESDFRQMIAVIGGAEPASIALHRACGFDHAGRLHAAGWKHGRWLDTVYMQRSLGDGSNTPGTQI